MAAGTKTPRDFTAKTVALLQDKVGRVGDTDLASYIDDAVKQYSADRPNEVVADKPGAGTNDIVLPTDFIDGWSELRVVEFPVGDIPATTLDPNEAYLYRSPTGIALRLQNDKPSAAQNARLTYTTYHTQGTDAPSVGSTISDADFPFVCSLAASFAASQMATSYAQSVDTQTDAIVVDGADRERMYRDAAKALRGEYDRHMGLGSADKGTTSGHGQGFADLDTKLLGATEPLTHSSRWS